MSIHIQLDNGRSKIWHNIYSPLAHKVQYETSDKVKIPVYDYMGQRVWIRGIRTAMLDERNLK